MEHEIIRDHATKRSRGFGFIVFDSEEVVDNMLANGNLIDMEGTQVSTQSDVHRYVCILCGETVQSGMSNSSIDGCNNYCYSQVKYHYVLLLVLRDLVFQLSIQLCSGQVYCCY